MAETPSVADRADVLMRRRRSFVAARNESPPPESSKPEAPAEEDNSEDIPVLTEVVVTETTLPEERVELTDETQEHLLASDIARAIGEQLTRDLPELLETVLLNAGENLRAGITATMETALQATPPAAGGFKRVSEGLFLLRGGRKSKRSMTLRQSS